MDGPRTPARVALIGYIRKFRSRPMNDLGLGITLFALASNKRTTTFDYNDRAADKEELGDFSRWPAAR